MKTSLACVLALCAFLALPGGLLAQNRPNVPAFPGQPETLATAQGLEFENIEVDFGQVDEGDKVEVVFPVRNTTDKPIKIVDLNTGCGCTQAKGNPEQVAPGEAAEIKVVYNTHGRRGPTSRRMTLLTDEGGRARYELRFTGDVISPLYWENPIVDFGEIDSGAAHTKEAILKSTVPGFEIKDIIIRDERLSAEVVGQEPFTLKDKEGIEYKIAVTIPDDYPATDFFTRLELESNDSENRAQPLNIRGTVLGDIVSSPKRIYAVLTPDSATSMPLVLESRSGKPISIKSLDIPKDFPVTFEIEDGEKPSEKKLIATLTANERARTKQGNVVVNLVAGEGDAAEEEAIDLRTIMVIRHTRIIRNNPNSPNWPTDRKNPNAQNKNAPRQSPQNATPNQQESHDQDEADDNDQNQDDDQGHDHDHGTHQ